MLPCQCRLCLTSYNLSFRYDKCQIYTPCKMQHQFFETYYKCHCRSIAKFSFISFYVGTGGLLSAAGITLSVSLRVLTKLFWNGWSVVNCWPSKSLALPATDLHVGSYFRTTRLLKLYDAEVAGYIFGSTTVVTIIAVVVGTYYVSAKTYDSSDQTDANLSVVLAL